MEPAFSIIGEGLDGLVGGSVSRRERGALSPAVGTVLEEVFSRHQIACGGLDEDKPQRKSPSGHRGVVLASARGHVENEPATSRRSRCGSATP